MLYLILFIGRLIDRGKIAAISEQIHLLSFTDRLAVAIMMCSTKIPQVYIEGFFHYTSDIKAKHTDIVIGNSYYEDFFTDNDKDNTDYRGCLTSLGSLFL